MSKVFSRRRLAAMSMAGVLSPMAGKAQTTDQAIPTTAPPIANPLATVAATPATAPVLGAIDKAKPYILYFQRSIDLLSAKHLRDTLVKLVDADVDNITLVVNSPGGLVAPTLQLYSLIQSLPVQIKTYGQSMVASSATILFLAGEQRTADKNTSFWLHAMSGPLITQINSSQFDEQMRLIHDQEASFDRIYKERTKIPPEDLAKIKRETIYYDASSALKYGIVSEVAPLKLPAKAKLVFFD